MRDVIFIICRRIFSFYPIKLLKFHGGTRISNKIAVVGINKNAICFDYEKRVVYFFRKGWASKTLKLVDIAIPFNKITAIELIKPTVASAGKIALIVDGTRLLAEDQFENNASELSVGDSIYPAVKEAVDRLLAECPDVQLITSGQLNVPKTKNQQDYRTNVTFEEFAKGDVKTTKTGGISVGALLVVAAVAAVCIYFLYTTLM